jgi:RAB6-interacting golgin
VVVGCLSLVFLLVFDRKKQTTAEARKLQQIQDELQKLDVLLSNDVAVLRDQIEVASHEFMEAQ